MRTRLLALSPRFHMSGPAVAGLYIAFSLTDLVLSLAAFSLGIPEANPVLALLLRHGLFVPAKVALTACAGGLIVALYRHDLVSRLAWLGILVMLSVDTYHIVSLHSLLYR